MTVLLIITALLIICLLLLVSILYASSDETYKGIIKDEFWYTIKKEKL